MASSFPLKKNSATRIVFPILDADGDPVSGAAGLDSEYSLDGGAFSDCAGEATEIGSSGIYYLDLAAGETNGDVVCIQIKTSTSGAKTTVLVFYTSAQTLDTVDANVDAIKTAVEHGTYGLSALKDIVEKIDDATDGLTAIKAEVEGLAGVAMRGTDSAALASVLATHDTDIKVYVDLIDDATNGLAAIKAEVEGLGGAAMRGTDNALLAASYTAPDTAGIATLLTRITAAVALASTLATHDTEIKALLAAIAGYIDTEVAAILAAVDSEVGSILTIVNNLPDGGALTALLVSIASVLTDTETTIPGLLATIQTDLDNPDQYKANVAALALEATLTAIKGAGWTNETLKLIKELVDELETGEKPKPKANFSV